MDKRDAQRRNTPLRYAAAFAGGALVGAVGIAAYTGRELNSPRAHTWRDNYTFTPFEVQVSYEEVSFVTEDGLTLRGWWFPHPESDRVVVAATGHKGTKPDLLGIGSGLWRAGYNVLLFDYRGCGESDPAPLSVGFYEQRDLRAASTWSRGRVPGARLGLIGFSMGAALSILAAATDPTIRVVVADSAYATLQGVVANAYGRYTRPVLALPRAQRPLQRLALRLSLRRAAPGGGGRKTRPAPVADHPRHARRRDPGRPRPPSLRCGGGAEGAVDRGGRAPLRCLFPRPGTLRHAGCGLLRARPRLSPPRQ